VASHELGDFLTARRAAVRPEDVGIPVHGHRRVQGLRREEVAMLAGVSVDYYTRLEQGRERHPSSQMVVALNRALGLTGDALNHLYRLAGLLPRTDGAGAAAEVVAPELHRAVPPP